MSDPTPQSVKSKLYFVIGSALLFLMALTWALDNSFLYIFLGAASIFLYLSYHHRAPIENDRFAGSRRNYTRPQRDSLVSFFKRFGQNKNAKSGNLSPNGARENTNRFVMFVLFFIGSIFLVIVAAVLFVEGDNVAEVNDDPWYVKAEAARYNGDYDSAEFYYSRILADDADDLDALNGLGILMINRENYDAAVSQFDKALAIDPDFEYARYNKALALFYQHNYRRSLSETFGLLRRSPQYFDAFTLAGDTYYEQQRYDSAKYWYTQAYDNGVRTAWVCHVLGYLYDRNSETEKAVDFYREALSYDSSKLEIYQRLSEIYPGREGDLYRKKISEQP